MNKKKFFSTDDYIKLNQNFNKIESQLFKNIIKNIRYGTYYIELLEEKLNSKYKLDIDNDWFNFFINFSKKYFIYKSSKLNFENKGIIRIISSFSYRNNIFSIKISQDLINIFNDSYNDFKLARFDNRILFKNHTFNLYTYLYDNHIFDNIVEIDLSLLKDILSINKEYSRFYDFEKNILKKSINEIKKYKNINIEYIKVKKKNQRNITSIIFFIKNKYDSLIEISTSRMIHNLNLNTEDKEIMFKYLKESISKYGKTFVENNFKYALLQELDIKTTINNDLYNNNFNNKLKEFNKQPIIYIENVYENKRDMILRSIKDCKKLNNKFIKLTLNIIEYIIINPDMYQHNTKENLYLNIVNFIRKNNNFIYKENNIVIIGEYNRNMKSRFAIIY
ncbi:hypothetical protein VC03_02190 [Sneathia vaginalis]|jgi:hypothetical protein|uniref:Uncharacterized protein n=1 Tax=Sneathia vaginalis TaxID=187101 RepID=A0A0E3ZAQ3_9FUSO|nr:replication initiation protein [Sneathia vaginalis]AKC95360.1 hypothetical protein VC03_02190 [Sneathia vaginalis]